jgi:putative DNA-invertase from lambdoid prophage Rac
LGQVAIYCRVSTEDQSCERQERDLRAFAKRARHEVVAVFRETATELSRWGRASQDLVQTLDDLHSWKVSVLAQTGLSFDLSTASGKLMRTIMAGLAEFERDLIRERVKSGLAAARSRRVALGRQLGQRPSDKKAKKVLQLHEEGLSYRTQCRIEQETVMDIIKRESGTFVG